MKVYALTLVSLIGVTACASYNDPYSQNSVSNPVPETGPSSVTGDPGYGYPPGGQYWSGGPGVGNWGLYGNYGYGSPSYLPPPSHRGNTVYSPPPITTRPPTAGPTGNPSGGGGIATRPPSPRPTRATIRQPQNSRSDEK